MTLLDLQQAAIMVVLALAFGCFLVVTARNAVSLFQLPELDRWGRRG